MPRRHHNGIVVCRERYLVRKIRKIPENDITRRGIVLFFCKILSVIVHHHAEAHRCQHRHERTPDMAAAEDVHAARMAQRLNIHAVFPNGLGGKIARSVLWDLSARDNVKLAYAVAVE